MDEPWPRPCRSCGVPYDGRLRGVQGRFHMAVLSVQEDAESLVLAGHWREGLLPPSGDFVLDTDGQERRFRASVEPSLSEAARERGQLQLRVLDGLDASAASSGCVWAQG